MEESDRIEFEIVKENHQYIGPSLSPDNYDDTAFCSCGKSADECDALILIWVIERMLEKEK